MNQISYILKGVLLVGLILIGVVVVKVIANIDSLDANGIASTTYSPSEQEINSEDAISYSGQKQFRQKCASCHNLYKESTGPALLDVLERGPWSDTTKLRAWIRNPAEFMKKDLYTKSLKAKYGAMMNSFPDLSDKEIDEIIKYISGSSKYVY